MTKRPVKSVSKPKEDTCPTCARAHVSAVTYPKRYPWIEITHCPDPWHGTTANVTA